MPLKLRKKWESINLNYMSEEDTTDGKILVKKLPWRSESKSLNRELQSTNATSYQRL